MPQTNFGRNTISWFYSSTSFASYNKWNIFAGCGNTFGNKHIILAHNCKNTASIGPRNGSAPWLRTMWQ